ncbi:MAG: DUF2306 domain-containing protein [Pseudoxanthomonas sp.]
MLSPDLTSYASQIASIAAGETRKPHYWLMRLAWCSIMVLAIHYVWRNAGRYLDLRPETYGYFWTKRAWLWLHLAGGATAVLLGPLQFVRRLRSAFPRAHRWTGRFYLAGVLCASVGAIAMVATTTLGWTTAYAFAVMIAAWLATALMALMAILKGHVEVHRDWMRRNYLITFAFVVFRLAGKIPGLYDIGTVPEVFTTFGWMSWVVPLLLSELWISIRQVLAIPPASSSP